MLSTAFLSPIVIPWVASSIAIVKLYSIIGIRDTFASVVIGHVLITLPFVVVASALRGFDHS